MLPVELLKVQPGDHVLDLCAAPGGKSTQIAAKLQNQGLLVSNDNHPDRVKALVKNVELFGIQNAIVTNETPERLADAWGRCFHKILIDAPCSGEGMFRKDMDMAKDWLPTSHRMYAAMQREILRDASRMLLPNGTMVYSTCTFSPEENEAIIAEFLKEHPQFAIAPIPSSGAALPHGFQAGRSEWLSMGNEYNPQLKSQLSHTVRLWPHHLQGEGHYVAVLQHIDSRIHGMDQPLDSQNSITKRDLLGNRNNRRSFQEVSQVRREIVHSFLQQFVEPTSPLLYKEYAASGDYIYHLAEPALLLYGLRISRPGLFLGTFHNHDRFEPSHALALALRRENAARCIHLSTANLEPIRYLKGETLQMEKERIQLRDASTAIKGYCLVCVDGFTVGWGKWQDDFLKNEYPSAWRWS
jgi:NOL1/NOP2/fmu family ribosome biogenesis protein/23S rRNA U2552 (ribose-2'-O)-methylase RlmE/FtsJ